MARRKIKDKRMERANKREYKRWVEWRSLIDPETAAWAMRDPDMRNYIASCRAVSDEERMRRERALDREQFKRRRFEKWFEYYSALDARG